MYTRPVKTTAVSEIIPDHLSVNNKQYIDFLDGYIKFLEQHESIIDYLRIIENNDIDTSNSIEDHYKIFLVLKYHPYIKVIVDYYIKI